VKSLFIHIGGDVVIPIRDVIAVLDIETTTISKDTREFLRIAEDEGFIECISEDIPKSFIIAEKDKKSRVYLSPISSLTLHKRAMYIDDLANIHKDKTI
jgi:hypothetical protein